MLAKKTDLFHFRGMRFRIFLLLFAMISLPLDSAERFWVFFKANGEASFQGESPAAGQRLARKGLDAAPALRVLPQDQIELLRQQGANLRRTSRYLNAVSIEIEDPEALERIRSLPGVASVQAFSHKAERRYPAEDLPQRWKSSGGDYGASLSQNEMLGIPDIHALGYDASGIRIAVFDSGFLLDHPVFDQIRIKETHDFVDGGSDVGGVGQEHGIGVLSVLAGYDPGQLIGPAYAAEFLLARTENDLSETPAEEDNWVAALEWADSLGAELVSSSLNYREFDNPADNYPYAAMDGQTAVVTRAANIAAARGILVVNAIGNEGSDPGSLWPPADSPLVLAVGALSSDGFVSFFSGRGPSFDGRIKPDVMAQGLLVYAASGRAGYMELSGTSYATPLMAGLVALYLQAHPALTPEEILGDFRASGDRAGHPDNSYGYGIPALLEKFPAKPTGERRMCRVYPNPLGVREFQVVLPQRLTAEQVDVSLYDLRARRLAHYTATLWEGKRLELALPDGVGEEDQLLLLKVSGAGKQYLGKIVFLTQ